MNCYTCAHYISDDEWADVCWHECRRLSHYEPVAEIFAERNDDIYGGPFCFDCKNCSVPEEEYPCCLCKVINTDSEMSFFKKM